MYGIATDCKYAFLPIDGRMIPIGKDNFMNYNVFTTSTRLIRNEPIDRFRLHVCYETARLGYIGPVAMTIAMTMAEREPASSVGEFSYKGIFSRLRSILYDTREVLYVSNTKALLEEERCPVCQVGKSVLEWEDGDESKYHCRDCRAEYFYNERLDSLTTPAWTFADLLEIQNDFSIAFEKPKDRYSV